jgi:hydrogenase maturation protein HypF
MRGFSLPGGALAFKEPRRAAIGLLFEIYGDSLFSMSEFLPLAEFSALEKMTLQQMLKKDIQINHTTSVGRIFDAFAALLGVCQRASYEGQAAAMLEKFCASRACAQSLCLQARKIIR